MSGDFFKKQKKKCKTQRPARCATANGERERERERDTRVAVGIDGEMRRRTKEQWRCSIFMRSPASHHTPIHAPSAVIYIALLAALLRLWRFQGLHRPAQNTHGHFHCHIPPTAHSTRHSTARGTAHSPQPLPLLFAIAGKRIVSSLAIPQPKSPPPLPQVSHIPQRILCGLAYMISAISDPAMVLPAMVCYTPCNEFANGYFINS